MNRLLMVAIIALMFPASLAAQTSSDVTELSRLLKEFLAGASRNDAAVHDRFWADDLIYTGSSGRRISKADIMRDTRAAPARRAGDPATTYSAEDIRIQQYDNTAIVAFRLVSTTTREPSGVTVTSYLNTGTFLKRAGKWQVVSWQATRMPRSEDDASREAAAVEASFHRAVLAADVKQLESVLDPNFIWTHASGEQMTRQQLIEQLRAGQLKYSKLETSKITVSVFGDTAVVRGVSLRQRNSVPGASGSPDAAPFTAFYTLTIVNNGSGWKAVAIHTSRT